MGNLNNVFKAFYAQYNAEKIRRAYGKISELTLFLNVAIEK